MPGFPGSITCPQKMMHDEWILAVHFLLSLCLVVFVLLMHLGSLVIKLITLSVLTSKDLCSKLHSPVLYFSRLTLNLWELHVL